METVKAALKANPRIARYVGDFFAAQTAQVYTEQTGRKFSARPHADEHARHFHVRAHGLA